MPTSFQRESDTTVAPPLDGVRSRHGRSAGPNGTNGELSGFSSISGEIEAAPSPDPVRGVQRLMVAGRTGPWP